MAGKSKSRIWDFLLVFAIVYLGYQLVFRFFFPVETVPTGLVTMQMQDATLRLGATPVVVIHNDTTEAISIPDRCPRPPVDVFRIQEGNESVDITSDILALPCDVAEEVPAGEKVSISLGPWKQSMFSEMGLYEIELPLQLAAQSGAVAAADGAENSQYRDGIIARFTINEPGAFTKLFRTFITKPLLNALIFFASYLPNYSLGWSIIILTLIVKLILFIPTQHSLEGQKKMQLLQPELEAVRKKYKEDPVKMQQETMKLWKEHKVNPFQSCLPLLVQFPVLIGLFYVIRDGSHLELSQHLIYPMYQNIDWTFGTSFLGLDLTQTYPWIFPPLLVVLQFIQMSLTFHIADKKQRKRVEQGSTKAVDTPQEMQQKIMKYVLPFMIGFFALRFPSAISVYWGVSTLFAIGQQIIVNREHIRVGGSSK